MEWQNLIIGPLSMAAGVLVLLAILAVFLWLTGKFEGFDPIDEMLGRDNAALGIRYAFFTVAVVFALLAIFDRAQGDAGALDFSLHALLATLLIHLSRYLNDWFILYDFDNNREVVGEKTSPWRSSKDRLIWPAPTSSAAHFTIGKAAGGSPSPGL